MRRYYVDPRQDDENDTSNNSDAEFSCDTCGENFSKPLLATVHSSQGSQQYYACPRCMIKVGDVETEKPEEKREKRTHSNDLETPRTMSKGGSDCGHFLGYLAKRFKDAPIPEECLTCNKMIECTIR